MSAPLPFRVLERFARAKDDPTPYDPAAPGAPAVNVGGDDRIVVTPHFAAVLDGVSSSRRVGGEPAGRVAARLGAEVLAALPPGASARRAVDRLSAALADAFPKDSDPPDGPLEGRRPAFALVAFSAARREVWRVADCQYLVDGAGDNPGIRVDAVAAQARAVVTRGALAAGRSVAELRRNDPGHAALGAHFRAQRALANHPTDPYGYGVIDGSPVPERFVEAVAVPAGAREVVLASDGYPELRPTLAASEGRLAEIARDDPLLIERFVSHRGVPPGRAWHDDRSWLRLELAP